MQKNILKPLAALPDEVSAAYARLRNTFFPLKNASCAHSTPVLGSCWKPVPIRVAVRKENRIDSP